MRMIALEDVFEPRRVDGGSLQADAMQKVLDPWLDGHMNVCPKMKMWKVRRKVESERMVH